MIRWVVQQRISIKATCLLAASCLIGAEAGVVGAIPLETWAASACIPIQIVSHVCSASKALDIDQIRTRRVDDVVVVVGISNRAAMPQVQLVECIISGTSRIPIKSVVINVGVLDAAV